MRVAIRKLPGIESVDVSLERAAVDIRLRAGNTVSLPQLRQIIKNNGFTAREATVTVMGGLIERGGKPALNVTGPNVVLLIEQDPKQTAPYEQVQTQLRARRAQAIELRGVVESRGDEPDRIVVTAVGASAK